MGFLSSLLGCHSIDKTGGPNFSTQLEKTIHLKSEVSINYKMPSNMSAAFNFEEKYNAESERTIFSDCIPEKYESFQWSNVHNLDKGIWDYGKPKAGLYGLAQLRLRIDLHQYNGSPNYVTSEKLEKFIARQYHQYLEGEKGVNTRTRQGDPNISDEEWGKNILKNPNDFTLTNINGTEYLSWTMYGENTGDRTTYFALPINEQCFVTFRLSYVLSASSEKELDYIRGQTRKDIIKFMQQVSTHKVGN